MIQDELHPGELLLWTGHRKRHSRLHASTPSQLIGWVIFAFLFGTAVTIDRQGAGPWAVVSGMIPLAISALLIVQPTITRWLDSRTLFALTTKRALRASVGSETVGTFDLADIRSVFAIADDGIGTVWCDSPVPPWRGNRGRHRHRALFREICEPRLVSAIILQERPDLARRSFGSGWTWNVPEGSPGIESVARSLAHRLHPL
jgi:hypothetical protein